MTAPTVDAPPAVTDAELPDPDAVVPCYVAPCPAPAVWRWRWPCGCTPLLCAHHHRRLVRMLRLARVLSRLPSHRVVIACGAHPQGPLDPRAFTWERL